MSYIYILTNYSKTTLYIGVTVNLEQRVQTHKLGSDSSFCRKYKCSLLIYYEEFDHIEQAILREKHLKGWRRSKKENLLATMNPNWTDLAWKWV